ncbi:SDR family oxidoreductase [Nonomuraea sp. NPDC052129]|uniref:SDR family oxidoreductase n=1 Tax=Nonomuraea sp. NPDC052129 TaxID=3154651 RepID=UPI00341B439D
MSLFALQDKVALVTGGSRGIGRAIAQRLAADGASVVVNYVQDERAAHEVVNAINETGGKAVRVRADMSRPDEVSRLFDEAQAAFGRLDVVVANAATALAKPVADCVEEDFDHVFDTNTKGVFFTLQEAARRVRDGGRIIAVSTAGTRMWFTDLALYLGSKGAVEQFVRVLSRELAPREITVNAVSPGYTDTDLLPERDRVVAAGMSAFNRVGTPTDVARVIAFLAGDDARWMTGQNVNATGGVI